MIVAWASDNVTTFHVLLEGNSAAGKAYKCRALGMKSLLLFLPVRLPSHLLLPTALLCTLTSPCYS